MKILTKLEKSKSCWALIGLSLFFFLLRLPSLIEPNWYGDEGIYQVLGMAANHGHMLYSEAWDNKPPFLYLTYALFDGDQFGVRIASLFVGILTVWLFFSLSQKLFKKLRVSVITTLIFILLFATPFIEGNIANAENFMLLPIITAAFCLTLLRPEQWKKHESKQMFILFCMGLLLGTAFLFKIVALFDFAAFFVYCFILCLPETIKFTRAVLLKTIRPFLMYALPYVAGFLFPILITVLYFSVNHALTDFIQATFAGNVGYVGYGNSFIIPQGFLIFKVLLLVGTILFLLVKRNAFSHTSLLILVWLAFSLFNAFFSQRPYTHYMLVLVPSICLLIGLLVNAQKNTIKLRYIFLLLAVLSTILTTFKPYSLKKTVFYYQNALLFVTGNKNVIDYQTFFDRKTPRDYQVASFIKMHTNDLDRIFVWGDSAQIYALSHTLPINKYTVAYHIRQSKKGLADTQAAINTIKPKYVIILSEAPEFPFQLEAYTNKFSLDRATVYERTF